MFGSHFEHKFAVTTLLLASPREIQNFQSSYALNLSGSGNTHIYIHIKVIIVLDMFAVQNKTYLCIVQKLNILTLMKKKCKTKNPSEINVNLRSLCFYGIYMKIPLPRSK